MNPIALTVLVIMSIAIGVTALVLAIDMITRTVRAVGFIS